MLVFFFCYLSFLYGVLNFACLNFTKIFIHGSLTTLFFIIAKSAKLSTNKVLKKLTYPSVTIVDNDTYEDYKRTRILP